MPRRIFPNSGGNYLINPVAPADVTITLYDASTFVAPAPGEEYTIRIGNELLLVTAKNGNILTVVRAQQGTTAGTYVAGDVVFTCLTAEDLMRLHILSKNGSAQGVQREVNFIDGTGIQTTVVDNPGSNRVDVTIAATSGNAQVAPPFRFPGLCAPFTPPPALNQWTWHNQGATVADEQDGVITLGISSTNTNNKLSAILRSIPASPYTVTAAIALFGPGAANYECGILLKNSGGNLMVSGGMKFVSAAPTIQSDKRSSVTTVPTNYFSNALAFHNCNWIRWRDDNTSRYLGWSFDGVHWNEKLVSTRTDYITPDQIGFYMDCTTNITGMKAYASLLSWKVE